MGFFFNERSQDRMMIKVNPLDVFRLARWKLVNQMNQFIQPQTELFALNVLDSSPLKDPDSLTLEFQSLGSWHTQFNLKGKMFGGITDYSMCQRFHDFSKWYKNGGRILELASFEGMHSFLSSQLPGVTEVVGLEGRDYNVRKAQFVQKLLKKDNVHFSVSNLEKVDLSKYGKFDVVFCAGLLYHLTKPWELIAEVAKVSDRFFLSTHYSLTRKVKHHGYTGKFYQEFGFEDSQSGLESFSFWPTYGELVRMLNEGGFRVKKSHHIPDYIYAPLVNLYCLKDV